MTIPQRLARITTQAEILILIAIAPALLFPSPQRLWVLVIPPLVWACAYATTGRVLPPSRLNAPLLALMAMVAISLIVTTDIPSSLGKVCGVTLGVLLFWSIARWLTTPTRLKLSAAAYVAAGAVLAVIGLLGAQWIGKFPKLMLLAWELPTVIRGVPGAEDGFNPNAVAGCLVLFVPVQIALVANGAHRWLVPSGSRLLRIGVVVGQVLLLMLTVATLILLQSISSWVSLLAAFGAFLLWHSLTSRLIAVCAVLVLVVVALRVGPQQFIDTTLSRRGASAESSFDTRSQMWRMAVSVIGDAPLTGVGMNRFRTLGPERYPSQLRPAGTDAVHAHNHLLQAAVDLGLPGMVAYAAIWVIVGWQLLTVWRQSSERIYRALAGGLAAGLVAHFVFSLGDAIPLGAKVGVLFWLTLALIEGLYRIAAVSPAGMPAPNQAPKPTSGA